MDLSSQERIGCDWALSASYVVLRLILLLPHEDSWIVDQALALVQHEGVKSLELLLFQRWLNFVPAVRPVSHDVHRRRWDVQAVLLVINGGFWAIFNHSFRRGWWDADDPLDRANWLHAVILLTCWKLIVYKPSSLIPNRIHMAKQMFCKGFLPGEVGRWFVY